MQKCSHKIPVNRYCPECEKLAKAKGLDEESQNRKAYDDWCNEIANRQRELKRE